MCNLVACHPNINLNLLDDNQLGAFLCEKKTILKPVGHDLKFPNTKMDPRYVFEFKFILNKD